MQNVRIILRRRLKNGGKIFLLVEGDAAARLQYTVSLGGTVQSNEISVAHRVHF